MGIPSVAVIPQIDPSVGSNDAELVVVEQMDYLKAKADEYLAEMRVSLNHLLRTITTASMPGTTVNYEYLDDAITVELPEGATRPGDPPVIETDLTIDGVDRPDITGLNPIGLETFEDVPEFDEDTPTDTFDYSESPYHSDLLEAVKSSLLDWIQNGGTGLTATVEAAIFARARARLTEEWGIAFDNADTFHSSRGFNIPAGPKNSLLRRVNADFERKVEDLNQKILEVQANLAQNNTQFAHTMSVTLEQNLSGHFNAVASRLFEAAKTTVELIYTIFEKKVQVYVARVQAISVGTDAKAKKMEAQVSVNKGITDQNIGETTRFKAEIDAILGVIDGQAKVYAAEINGYEADISFAKIEADTAVERLKALIAQSTNQTELQIKDGEVSLQAYISSLGLNIDVSKAIATILTEIAAGSLSGLNVHAGMSDSASKSYSGTYSHGESIGNSASHTYSENLTVT